MQPHTAPQPLTGWRLFQIWTRIGLQSFGGGAATTLLIQRTFIDELRVVSAEEFARLWILCLLAPGINLIAVAILLGKRLGGLPGVVLSLAGFLLPSATITCLLAALFGRVEHIAAVQAVVRGVIPATGGIMLVVGVNFLRPLLPKRTLGSDDALPRILVTLSLITVCAGAVIRFSLSPILAVLGAAAVGALCMSPCSTKPTVVPATRHEPEQKTEVAQ